VSFSPDGVPQGDFLRAFTFCLDAKSKQKDQAENTQDPL